MKNIFSLDSPLVQALGKFADLIILNILYLISCIPIITIGAATAALYDVTARLSKDEALVWRHYWQAFRSNFKKATLIWLLMLLIGGIVYGCSLFYLNFELPNKELCTALLWIVSIVLLCVQSWAFPLQARFENTVKNTLTNSILFTFSYLPRTIAIALINAIPAIVFLYLPGVFLNFIFVFLIIWFSLGAFVATWFLKKPMRQLEELAEEE